MPTALLRATVANEETCCHSNSVQVYVLNRSCATVAFEDSPSPATFACKGSPKHIFQYFSAKIAKKKHPSISRAMSDLICRKTMTA